MPIPASERVIYAINPLVEVICQVRYPTVFRIESEPPVAFQESLRDLFPIAQQKQIATLVPPELLSLLPEPASRSLPLMTAYDFTSRDGNWTVSLTRDFLALTARKYIRWEQFRELFNQAAEALQRAYAVRFYVRVGLRYQDVICRSQLGMEDVAWRDLLRPSIAGELGEPDIAEEVIERLTVTRLRLPQQEAFVRLQHGLVTYRQTSESAGEVCYLIDADFFTERQVEVQDVDGVLDYLNQQAGNLFRWCISQKLHHALQPRHVEG